MEPDKSIDVNKTEKAGSDSAKYGDASDLGLTHYLGNDENKPREKEGEEKKTDKEIGQEALGNVESE
ncbi:MAG TPA: hypothetical protein VKZ84_06250 [Bacteriovoracaceae bacterium]|nr:hypothetical protein [Bacteriovoracaceae bacterium]